MKKIQLFVCFTLILELFSVAPHALAGSSTGRFDSPNPNGTPGARATEKAGQHGKHENYRGTIAAVDDSSLTLTLKDGSTKTFSFTADTWIKVPGGQNTDNSLQAGMKATVQTVVDQSGNQTVLAVLAIPGKPIRAHRVGVVTDYTTGTSVTIQASDGNTYMFTLTGDTKILPTEKADQLAVGSRVTIIAPRVPSSTSLTATGIVVHPAN